MALIVGYKNKKTNKCYLIADGYNGCPTGDLYITNKSKYRIQVIDGIAIAYVGKYNYFYKMVNAFDFKEVKNKLSIEYIYNEFYPKFVEFLLDNKITSLDENEKVKECDFCIMIMGKGQLYDIGATEVFIVDGHGINASGNNSFAFGYFDSMDDSDDFINNLDGFFKANAKSNNDISYPFVVLDDDMKEYKIYQKDGSVSIESNFENWSDND